MIELQSKEFKARCRTLAAELDILLAHPDAEGIIGNDWLHDENLPVPSVELIRYFAICLFLNQENHRMAEEHDRYALTSYIIAEFRKVSPENRAVSIPLNLSRLDCSKYLTTGKQGSDSFIHEWLPLVSPFLSNPSPSGYRILARGFLETLTLRAIHTRDHARLHSLANAVRLITHGENAPQSVENRIKAEILRNLPYLGQILNRCPSRSEIELFTKTRADELGKEPFSDNRNSWSNAYQELGYPGEQRKIRMAVDANRIVALARQSAKE